MKYDLLKTVTFGGCSAKLSASELSKALAELPSTPHPNLLVGTETHDDAGVYKINDELALIQTTDFFPPVCSNPYEFGQIAAANALSDIYAMGGEVMSVLNIVGFPAHLPLEVLRDILKGGIEKVIEAGGVVMGGHTIVDDVPKYGLAVTGTIHPEKIITNAAAKPGDVLILTKPIGTGIIMAGHRIGEASDEQLQTVLNSMKQLNKAGTQIMQAYHIKSATDITGFGILGHALKMALGSEVTIQIDSDKVPFFDGVSELLEVGCIPGACFRNLEYVEAFCQFDKSLDYNKKMLLLDAQTSGGLLICCPEIKALSVIHELQEVGFPASAVIGKVIKKENVSLIIQ
ncbi:MAG: selenide, water dikinase SelD [Bacteroidales bacterium]|nr:selenide, water dikinase SelD [Bacteroidales bacterium]